MPRALFDQTLAPRTRNTRPVSTVSLSVLLHAVALAAVFAFHITASSAALPDATEIPVFVARSTPQLTPPAPKPIRPVTPTPAVADVAPTVQPSDIRPEAETVPASGPPSLDRTIVGPPGGSPDFFGPQTNIQIAPPPQPPRPAFVRVGGDIKPPTRLAYVPPTYPSIAQTARVEGEVLLEATIDETGAVRNVVVRQSIPLLDRAAIEAVSKWRYSPTLLNGQPVAVIMTVGVKFSLR